MTESSELNVVVEMKLGSTREKREPQDIVGAVNVVTHYEAISLARYASFARDPSPALVSVVAPVSFKLRHLRTGLLQRTN